MASVPVGCRYGGVALFARGVTRLHAAYCLCYEGRPE